MNSRERSGEPKPSIIRSTWRRAARPRAAPRAAAADLVLEQDEGLDDHLALRACAMHSNTRGKELLAVFQQLDAVATDPAVVHGQRSMFATSGAWSDRCDQGRAAAPPAHARRRCARRCGPATAPGSARERSWPRGRWRARTPRAAPPFRAPRGAAAPVVEVAGDDQRGVGGTSSRTMSHSSPAAAGGAPRPGPGARRWRARRPCGPAGAARNAAGRASRGRSWTRRGCGNARSETSTAPRCRGGPWGTRRCGRRRTAARWCRPGIRSAAPRASCRTSCAWRECVPSTSCRNTTSAPTVRTASRSSGRMNLAVEEGVKPLWMLTVMSAPFRLLSASCPPAPTASPARPHRARICSAPTVISGLERKRQQPTLSSIDHSETSHKEHTP
jgi:hypothetical protein